MVGKVNNKPTTTTPTKKVEKTETKVATPAKDNKVVAKSTPAKDTKATTPAKENKVATPAKETKAVESPATTNNNNNNKKRKEPEPKAAKPAPTTPTKDNKTTTPAKDTKPTTTTTPNKDQKNNKNVDNKKTQEKPTTPAKDTKPVETKKPTQQPSQKKQKSESTPSTKDNKPTTTTTTPTPTPTPTTSTFSIFDSLKKIDSKSAVSTTTNTNNKQQQQQNNKKSNKTDTTTTTTTDNKQQVESSKNLLTEAFSKVNQYSEPDVKLINEKIQDVLKEIKESSPEEISRKEQKDKLKLKVDSSKRREEQNPRTVFVSNINLENANDKELKQIFKEFGMIESIRFRSIPLSQIDGNRKETFIKKEFHEKRETCNAYIVYKQIDSAKKAVKEMNGKEFFGKHLRVDMADHKPTKESDAKTIFIGNIPYESEEEELFLIFDKTFGDVASVRIVRDSHSNIGKGFGYVNFKSEKSASDAITQKSIQFSDREIRIFPTKSNPKKGKTIKEKKKILNRKPSTRLPQKKE